MTIIVTGGAGFIGSNFVFHMLNKYPEYRIICLDKLTYAGNLSTLAPVMDNPNFRFVKADICDREAVYKLFEEARHGKVITALRRSMIVLHDNYQPIRRSHYHSFGWDWSQWNDLLSRESDKTQMLFDYILERWDKSNDLADILESYIKENFKEKAYSEFAESDYLLSFMANSSATDIYFGENDWQIAMNGEVRHGIFLSRRNAYILREFGGDSKSTKSNPCAVSGTGWSVSYQGSDPKGNRIVFTHAQLPEAVEVSYKSKQDGSGTLEINSPSTKLLQLSNAIVDENQSVSLNYEMESFDPSTIKNLIIDILVKLSSTEDVI